MKKDIQLQWKAVRGFKKKKNVIYVLFFHFFPEQSSLGLLLFQIGVLLSHIVWAGRKMFLFLFFNVNTALEFGALNSVIGALGNSQGRAADSLITSEASWAAGRGPH